jgi:hypothetical protein
MSLSPWWSCVLASSLVTLTCSCDGSDSGGTAGRGGDGSASGDSGAAAVDNPDPINDSCPANDVGPHDGPFGLKGDCCYRTSNKARIDDAAATRTLEFRVPYFMLINHQQTIDPTLFGATTIERFENEEQNLLVRFELPQQDGKLAKGKGKLKIGPGRYNCDGTYSFYSDKAAPTDSGAADRWFVPEVELDVTNPAATDRTLVTAPFKKSLAIQNRASYLPYLGGAPDFELDWEGSSQGFDFLELPIGEENYDCVGARTGSKWTPGGKSVAYGRLDLNDGEQIDALGITFCQLMAFGARTDAPSCQTTTRCMPGEPDCAWQRLPDSLCPTSDEEKSSWGCHLGYADNPDNAPLEPNCSEGPPGEIDPDNGTSEGQCCDPLAREDSGLPACNAWAQINELVAAAVEITDKNSDALQQSCHGK